MEDDKRGDRNLAKAEAARRLACLQQGTFWIGTARTLTKRRHYNLVFLHARRKTFPAFSDIAAVLPEVWPWGEMAEVAEVASRLSHQFPVDLVEAAIWKVVADAAAQGHLLLDLEQYTLSRTLPLALLPPDAPVLVPSPLPDTLLPESETTRVAAIERQPSTLIPGPTFDASTLPEPQRAQFHRNLRAVEQVLAGATQSSVAEKEGIPRSTLSRKVRRTRERGQIACVPHGSYRRATSLHPAFAECIRRLFGLPTPTRCATSFTSTAIRFESILHRFSFSRKRRCLNPCPWTSASVEQACQGASIENTAALCILWARLIQADESLARTAGQVEAFCHLLRQRQGYRLRGWLEEVEQHGEPELQAFARHLHKEESAVQAGLTRAESN